MPNILVIDDDKMVGEAAAIMLRAKGYRVDVAHDGPSGIEAVKANRFDLVIVDLFMPTMNGLDVMARIHQVDPAIPVIVASGFMFKDACPSMPEFEAMALEAGAVGTIYKPFRPAEIFPVIERALPAAA